MGPHALPADSSEIGRFDPPQERRREAVEEQDDHGAISCCLYGDRHQRECEREKWKKEKRS